MWALSYWVFPVVSAFCWLSTLLGLLTHWLGAGRPRYPSMDASQSMAYISDVGAQSLKPLFIAGACATSLFLDLAFASERWLRHRGRLARNTSATEKALCALSMACAVVGTVGLIGLSVFDTLRHPTLHDLMLALFLGGYVVSAVCICAEYQRLGVRYREHRILRAAFWAKLFFILLEVALAGAFALCNRRGRYDATAVLEWAMAFVFTFYALSFCVDLAPAIQTRPGKASAHVGAGEHETEMQRELACERGASVM